MLFVACGLNHKTAPLDLREQVAIGPAQQDVFLQRLMSQSFVHEATLLSTCNRTEIYCSTNGDAKDLHDWFARQHNLSFEQLKPHLYTYLGDDAVRHALRVASGLDSMMIGEPQILGQLKKAYQMACQVGTVKSSLRGVFEYVFSASKRIRNQSEIGKNPISVAYAAVQLIGQHLQNFSDLNVLLIGSGETSTLVAKYLHEQGVKQYFIASRTLENAAKLAQQFDGNIINIADIPSELYKADVVVSATSCPLPFINQSLVQHSMELRQQRPVFFLDLAVPRDIEPDVGNLPNVHLYNVDDLQDIIEVGLTERRNKAFIAEQLISAELNDYVRWHRSLRANEVICSYRNNMERIANKELERSLHKLRQGQSQELILQELSSRLLGKLSHHTTVGLKKMAQDEKMGALELANYLLNSVSDRKNHETLS